ncbi:hypothetical protein [Cumulibacter manganitolerans]|uniref:hypothetical protein n=1 Tax=Cumulibacter manganitolerans TaxID=1884992 RepID=UPI001296D426|nr:hypothetical protein [Cumulibacter manganitolerans]
MTTSTTHLGCGCGGTAVAATPATSGGVTGCATPGAAGMERTRYFTRQLVGADDLTQDQLYQREKSRRHNRMLHGWGIVCGARVRAGDAPCEVVVESGYVLGPYGDEIVIDGDVVIDVCSEDLDGNVSSPCAPADPWCAGVRVDRPSGAPLYLAVAYAECLARPVRAVSDGCGCDDSACEYSRIRDSYRVVVLDRLPATYPVDTRPPRFADSVTCTSKDARTAPTRPNRDGEQRPAPCACPACGPCPSEPWVILADLTVDGSAVTDIDCDAHRRYVARFGDFYFTCGDGLADDERKKTLGALKKALTSDAISTLSRDGALADALTLPGEQLAVTDVQADSPLAAALKKKSIRDIAMLRKDDFVKLALTDVPEAEREAVEAKAAEAWAKAAEVYVALNR